MQDEQTRKYLQSIKRLLTFAQRKYPALPSMCWEFNSGVQGSDKQARSVAGVRHECGGRKRSEPRLEFLRHGAVFPCVRLGTLGRTQFDQSAAGCSCASVAVMLEGEDSGGHHSLPAPQTSLTAELCRPPAPRRHSWRLRSRRTCAY